VYDAPTGSQDRQHNTGAVWKDYAPAFVDVAETKLKE